MVVAGKMSKNKIDTSIVYTSQKYGRYRIIEEIQPKLYPSGTCRMCKIKFENTGAIIECRLSSAKNGAVIDPYARTIHGVGYLGETKYVMYDNKMYNMWNGMLDRCYDPKNKDYAKYGGKGVRVDPRWHCFVNFVEDVQKLPGWEDYLNCSPETARYYALDKDILQSDKPVGERVYSKDTCCIVYDDYNTRFNRLQYRETHETGSKYFGVSIKSGKDILYQTVISIRGVPYYLGVYDDEVAAANVYNYVASRCVPNPILNNAPEMDINEAFSHCRSKKPFKFPPEIDTTNFNIPFQNHSLFYGVKKKRDNFYGLYSDSEGCKHIGVFDNEVAAASAHNHYVRIKGHNSFRTQKINEESETFHEMPIEEALSHKTYTAQTEPEIMCATVEENGDLKWYDDRKYTYKSKHIGIKSNKDRFTLEIQIENYVYQCGAYNSYEAAVTVYNYIMKYFNMPYDEDDITMSFEEALSHLKPHSTPNWPEDFTPDKAGTHRAFNNLPIEMYQRLPECMGGTLINSNRQECKDSTNIINNSEYKRGGVIEVCALVDNAPSMRDLDESYTRLGTMNFNEINVPEFDAVINNNNRSYRNNDNNCTNNSDFHPASYNASINEQPVVAYKCKQYTPMDIIRKFLVN